MASTRPYGDSPFGRRGRSRKLSYVHPSDFPLILTSKPYPVDVVEALAAEPASIVHLRLFGEYAMQAEALDAGQATLFGLQLKDQGFAVYGNYQPEAIDASQAQLTTLSLVTIVFHEYTMQAEALDAAQAGLTGFALKNALITYDRYPAEALDAAQAQIIAFDLS